MNDLLAWISNWMTSHSNGEWERMYGVRIETTDTPGWGLTIDLTGTELENLELELQYINNGEQDWYTYSAVDNMYYSGGDLSKLEVLLQTFKSVAEQHSKMN